MSYKPPGFTLWTMKRPGDTFKPAACAGPSGARAKTHATTHRDPRIISPLGNFFPDWLTWSQREYGARVGIFRVLEVLDQFGVTPSVALGAAAAKRYPELVDELLRRNACFLAHGTHATRRITARMSEAE